MVRHIPAPRAHPGAALRPVLALCLAFCLSACQAGDASDSTSSGASPTAAGAEAAAMAPAAATAIPSAMPAEATAADAPGLAGGAIMAADTVLVDDQTLAGPWSFIDGYPALNPDGTVNAVIEIPAGHTSKWEVLAEDGLMHWDIEDGRPRMVQYLGYPVNYGMVPGTLLSEALGGDGDPLDILVLGEAIPRGSVVPVRVIALARYTDGGERDDKLVAVRADSPFGELADLAGLEAAFGGIPTIVDTWFLNYKGPGVFEAQGWAEAAVARALLDEAAAAYAEGAGGALAATPAP